MSANGGGGARRNINMHFTLASGTYSDEQNLITHINTFLTTTISGWERIVVVSDTGTDRNFIYTCSGSRPDDHEPGYVGFRGTANTFAVNPFAKVNRVTGATENNANDGALTNGNPVGTTTGRWWFIGNNDVLFISTAPDSTPNTYYLSGAGFWKSYLDHDYDPKPWWGMSQSVSTGTFESELDRVRSFGVRSFGKSAFWPDSTLSGTARDYFCIHHTLSNVMQARSNQPYPVPMVFVNYGSTTTHIAETRGEIPGLYQIGLPTSYFTGNVLTVSGIGDISGNYFVQRSSNANTWAIGRITRIV